MVDINFFSNAVRDEECWWGVLLVDRSISRLYRCEEFKDDGATRPESSELSWIRENEDGGVEV